MQVTVADELWSNPNLMDLVEQANAVFRDEAGGHADMLTVDWDLETERDTLRPVLTARVADTGACSTAFHVTDFADMDSAARRLPSLGAKRMGGRMHYRKF